MNTNKSALAKRRKAFPKTSIKFEKRFKQIFYFPEIGSHAPFPSPRDFFTLFPQKRACSQANKRGKGLTGGREGRVI